MNNWTKEQMEAITKEGSNIIVSASAGSGKTAVLTERVINKLKKGIHLNQLLILTFTNNAAAEMRLRIKKAIQKDISLKEELEFVNSAEITTFDAYALSLIRKYYLYLNINPNIKIIDNDLILLKKEELLTDIFNEYFENKKNSFLKFIDDFSVKNDNEIKKLILNVNTQVDLLIDKESYLKEYIEKNYSKDKFDNYFAMYEKSIFSRINSIKNILSSFQHEVNNDYYNKYILSIKSILSAENFEEVQNIKNIKPTPLPKNSSEKAKLYKSQISKLLKEIEDLSVNNKEELFNDYYSTKTNAEIIIEILIKLNEKINNFKRYHNTYEFIDISKMAIELVKTNKEILDKLKLQYHEIMIDEYQDTNDIQETFISLISNNNVYMVGDIKQSIYRFRNANPNIFKLKYDQYKNLSNGIKIDLNKNFRSREQVLTAINEIFNHIMDDDIGNANYKCEHQMIFGNNAYLDNNENNDLSIINYKPDNNFSKEEYEAFIIANDIKDKIYKQVKVFDNKILRPCQYKDFCILMDRTNAFEIYKKVFDYLKIPINIFKDENITNSDEIFIFKNIISLIISIRSNDYENLNFYYAGIARSYLYNLSDQEIFDTIKDNKVFNSDIFTKCKSLILLLDNTNNYNFVLKIIEKFNFYSRTITAGNINYRNIILNNILEKSQSLNDLGLNISDFNNFLDTMINNNKEIKISAISTDKDAITLTNIHKSKGLEYKICYYSGLYKEFYLKDIKDRIIFNSKFGFILPAYYDGYKPCITSFLNKENYVKEEISEKLRLFYVALTRAKEKIIMISPIEEVEANVDNKNIVDYIERLNYKSFKNILESIYPFIKKYITDISLPKINKEYKHTLPISLDSIQTQEEKLIVNEKIFEKILIKSKTFSKKSLNIFDKKTIENLEYGKHLHYLLEITDFINPDYSSLKEDEALFIKSFLKTDILKNIRNANIYKEFEFIYEDAGNEYKGIIDLLVIYEDYIDIIDYKLKNIDDDAYITQLHGYKKFISNKFNKQTNTYLYSLYDKKLIKFD